MESKVNSFDIQSFIKSEQTKLNQVQQAWLAATEASVKRGDVKTQQINAFEKLTAFWRDSAHSYYPFVYYLFEEAKLVNSEKKLTFAARLLNHNLRREEDPARQEWQRSRAIELFEKAILLQPENDSLKVELASCYVLGNSPDIMEKGIKPLKEIVAKDSTNMQAQLVLAIGGFNSGQYDKAIERLLKVTAAEPNNIEAVAYLADAYAAMKDRANAEKWYRVSKKIINDPAYSKEVDERIKNLK